jgi:hypothetical protein
MQQIGLRPVIGTSGGVRLQAADNSKVVIDVLHIGKALYHFEGHLFEVRGGNAALEDDAAVVTVCFHVPQLGVSGLHECGNDLLQDSFVLIGGAGGGSGDLQRSKGIGQQWGPVLAIVVSHLLMYPEVCRP